MKKILLALVSLSLLLAGCAKEQMKDSSESAETVSVNFTAALSDEVETRALFDGDGFGAYADQCLLQVWWNGKLFYEKTAPVSNLRARFDDIILIKDQTYDFLFWADNAAGAYYDTETLMKVKIVDPYIGCTDRRDAFSAAIVEKTVTETFSQDVILYRPFAQLNVITTDIPALRAQMTDDALFAASVPEKVKVTVTAPTVFNVKTGVASDPQELTYTAPVYTKPYKTTTGAKNTLSMDYFLAPTTEGNVAEVKFSAKNETSGLADINYTFSNIPLRRNYRTNITGALITVTGDVRVWIMPLWYGRYNEEWNQD